MVKVLKVLAVDDHKSVLEVYDMVFNSIDKSHGSLQFFGAADCTAAYTLIKNNTTEPFELAVLDYKIPPFPQEGLSSGYEIALLLRKAMPECKIIFITMEKDRDTIEKVLSHIQPEGFIHKTDCTLDELLDGFSRILRQETFYSQSIAEMNITEIIGSSLFRCT